ncbi:MAG: hypothetical protein FWH28_08415 [Clostridiales bacterium]|nr:hypothetical protein [Clostridiales bacterium]
MQKNHSDTEPILLCSLSDEMQADMVVAALKEQEIPVLRKAIGAGQYLSTYMGFSTQGVEIYTSPECIDKAREVLDVILGTDEDSPQETFGEETFGEETIYEEALSKKHPSRRIIIAILLLIVFGFPVILRMMGILFLVFGR